MLKLGKRSEIYYVFFIHNIHSLVFYIFRHRYGKRRDVFYPPLRKRFFCFWKEKRFGAVVLPSFIEIEHDS